MTDPMQAAADLDAIAEQFSGYITAQVDTPPTGEEMLAAMRRILNDLPRPVVVCHPDDEARMADAIRRLPFPLPAPELRTNPFASPGSAIYIADARPYLDGPDDLDEEAEPAALVAEGHTATEEAAS